MTTHYIDITLLPDPEFSDTHLLSALMSKLHRVLAQLRADDIGISFPRHSLHPRTLGKVLRLHGSEVGLTNLMSQDWLRGMRDHLHFTLPAVAPASAQHRTVQRRQFKTNAERLRRRRMRRKHETAEQAAAAIPDSVEHRPALPYVQLRSTSSKQTFCLFVVHGPLQSEPTDGTFNTYGLSNGTTIPWF